MSVHAGASISDSKAMKVKNTDRDLEQYPSVQRVISEEIDKINET